MLRAPKRGTRLGRSEVLRVAAGLPFSAEGRWRKLRTEVRSLARRKRGHAHRRGSGGRRCFRCESHVPRFRRRRGGGIRSRRKRGTRLRRSELSPLRVACSRFRRRDVGKVAGPGSEPSAPKMGTRLRRDSGGRSCFRCESHVPRFRRRRGGGIRARRKRGTRLRRSEMSPLRVACSRFRRRTRRKLRAQVRSGGNQAAVGRVYRYRSRRFFTRTCVRLRVQRGVGLLSKLRGGVCAR